MAFGTKTKTTDPQPTEEVWPESQLDPNADYTADPAPEGMAEPAVTPEVPEVLNGTGKTRRGRPKLGDLPTVSKSDLGGGMIVPESEWEENPVAVTPTQVRDEAQQDVDGLVKDVYDAWIAADKPPAKRAPRARYVVKPEFEATTKAMLTRAGTFHKVKVTTTPHYQPDGMVALVFTVRDRDPKKSK